MSDFDWSQPGAVDRLKQLFAAGKSASQICLILGTEFLGYLTRNSVIGKVHRLDIKRGHHNPLVNAKPRVTRPRPETSINVKAVAAARQRAAAGPELICEPVPDETLPPGEGITLDQLTNTTCRWPYGEPGTDGFRYCGKGGADFVAGRPWCPGHRLRAFNSHARVMGDDERHRRAMGYRRRMAQQANQHQEA